MLQTIVPNQPVIETSRFDLRPLRTSDVGLITLNAGDPRVAMNTAVIPHPLPPGAIEALIARSLSEDRIEDVWAIDGQKSSGSEVMGLISLSRIERSQSEIGYWTSPAFWNAGLASEAVEALVRANPQDCRTIFASAFQDNPASARVLINCGFCYLGDAETFCVARGAKVPTWTYSLKLD